MKHVPNVIHCSLFSTLQTLLKFSFLPLIHFCVGSMNMRASLVAQMVKYLSGHAGDLGSIPESSVYGISQARKLECVVIAFSK